MKLAEVVAKHLAEAQRTGVTDPDETRRDDMTELLDALVMMVDDEPLNIEVTQIHLEEAGYRNFIGTSDPTQALPLLVSKRPDVLLLDLIMPELSGIEILTRMQAEKLLQDVPTIVLTSSRDSETKLQVLELGATDFLAKPVDASELVLRLRNTLAAKAYRDRLANYDLLTGLPNRHTFIDRLEWSLRLASRYGHHGAVLHLGLDAFKQINEALGPAIGDSVLQAVARRLEQCIRGTDTLARLETEGPRPSLSRLSGDEFTVLLPVVVDSEAAGGVADRILSALAAPFDIADRELNVSCTIGIALFPDDGEVADTVVKNAGAAMHHAKQHRKQTFQYYSTELNARALHKLNLAAELRKAIERDELCLYYQPKIDVVRDKLTGAEALVRWRHPARGLVPPGEFIPLAEENGLIVALGEWVLRAACMQISAWGKEGHAVPPIAVNVSSAQVKEVDLAGLIGRLLTESGARAEQLTIELTEGVLIENAQANIAMLNRLKTMGLKLSIDDFGTGYSSLSYLNMFPLDELKIDRSFITQIDAAEKRTALVGAIIAMAHSLGFTVVAEGVETAAQLAFLEQHGCDTYQGFLKSPPVPAERFAAAFLAVGRS